VDSVEQDQTRLVVAPSDYERGRRDERQRVLAELERGSPAWQAIADVLEPFLRTDDDDEVVTAVADAVASVLGSEPSPSVSQQETGDGVQHDPSVCEREIKAMLERDGRPSLKYGGWQDGDELTCPSCGARWVHVCDEAEGCSWDVVVDRGVAASVSSQQEGGEHG
jgi:hypothetical protein